MNDMFVVSFIQGEYKGKTQLERYFGTAREGVKYLPDLLTSPVREPVVGRFYVATPAYTLGQSENGMKFLRTANLHEVIPTEIVIDLKEGRNSRTGELQLEALWEAPCTRTQFLFIVEREFRDKVRPGKWVVNATAVVSPMNEGFAIMAVTPVRELISERARRRRERREGKIAA